MNIKYIKSQYKQGKYNCFYCIYHKLKLETAQEVPVQEQLVKDIIKKELKTFKIIQIVIDILIIFSIVLQLIAIVN